MPFASMIESAWLIPLLPLVAAVVTLVLGAKVLKNQAHWPCVLALGGSAVCALVLLVEVIGGLPEGGKAIRWIVSLGGYEWIWSGNLKITIELLVDPLCAVMLTAVTVVSFCVGVYSIGYMHGERGYFRFFAEISLFVFSMTMLVLASNFLLLYVFWEAVGLCSYLLIGFYYQRPAAAAAAKKAFVVNRIGDFGFGIGILMIFWTFGRLGYADVFARAGGVETGIITTICLLLFVGAVGKSAQMPLHVWLPDAMEGPSPVSALIHAATMVTAGVYMVARCTPLFSLSPTAQSVVAIVGCATAAVAAITALTQTDLKRILAYSTVSQLGYMFLGLGMGTPLGIVAAIFHLFTHAFFKGLLFLGAGSVMHAMGGVIDIRKFGGLRKKMPVTCWTFCIGSAALAGFPLLFAGFWSKDAILHAVELNHQYVLLVIGLGTALLTAFYTFRAFFSTFFGPEVIPEEAGHHAHESPKTMTVPLVVLAVGAILAGFLCTPAMPLLEKFLLQTPRLAFERVHHGTLIGTLVLMVVSGLLALAGILVAMYWYAYPSDWPRKIAEQHRPLYLLSYNKFWFDEWYDRWFVEPLFALARACRKIDDLVVDGLVHFVADMPGRIGRALRPVQSGVLQSYGLAMALGVAVILVAVLLAR